MPAKKKKKSEPAALCHARGCETPGRPAAFTIGCRLAPDEQTGGRVLAAELQPHVGLLLCGLHLEAFHAGDTIQLLAEEDCQT